MMKSGSAALVALSRKPTSKGVTSAVQTSALVVIASHTPMKRDFRGSMTQHGGGLAASATVSFSVFQTDPRRLEDAAAVRPVLVPLAATRTDAAIAAAEHSAQACLQPPACGHERSVVLYEREKVAKKCSF